MNLINNQMKITKDDLEKIKNSKIYFGHKSVGFNIMNGINDLLKEMNYNGINILVTNDAKDFSRAIFAHSENGENGRPRSKIDSFADLINKNLREKVNIAFFKFCYVDIVENTDIDSVFNYYKKNMNELKSKYPKIKFIHFTVPLATHKKFSAEKKIKDIIKSIIGRKTLEEEYIKDNVSRSYYNKLIRSAYKGHEIFDLAETESSYPDGKKEMVSFENNKYESLIPEYTDDGGHLNNTGRLLVANRLLKFLAEINK